VRAPRGPRIRAHHRRPGDDARAQPLCVRALSSASSPMLPAAWEQALELASEALAPRGTHRHRYACTPWEDAVRPGVHRVAALIAQQRAHRGLLPRIRVPRGTECLSVCVLFDRLDVVLLSTINITMFVWTSAWVAKGLPRVSTKSQRIVKERENDDRFCTSTWN